MGALLHAAQALAAAILFFCHSAHASEVRSLLRHSRALGCNTNVDLRIENNLGFDVTLDGFYLKNGRLTIGSNSYFPEKNKKNGFQTLGNAQTIENGQNLVVTIQNSAKKSSNVCDGASGTLGLSVPDGTSDSYGLNSATLIFDNSGGPNGNNNWYWYTLNQGSANTNAYGGNGAIECQGWGSQQGKTVALYNPNDNKCAASQGVCATNPDLLYNFCPFTGSTNTSTGDHINCDVTLDQSKNSQGTVVYTLNNPAYKASKENFSNYTGIWKQLGSGTTYSKTISVSGTITDSKATETGFSNSLESGASTKFLGIDVSAKATETWSTSTTLTFEDSLSASSSSTCTSIDCSGGTLYQWQVMGYQNQNTGMNMLVPTCNFLCIQPNSAIKCPLGYCKSTTDCSCCLYAWMNSTSNAKSNNCCGNKCKTPPNTIAVN